MDALVSLAFLSLRGDSVYSPEEYTTLATVEYRQPELEANDSLSDNEILPSKAQLDTLFSELSQKNREASIERVDKSLRLIATASGGSCTALQIDEGGIYLTARHCLFSAYKGEDGWQTSTGTTEVKDPYSGEVHRATGFIAHPNADIGLLFAPTGKEFSPVDGVRIATQTTDGEQISLNGFIPSDLQDGPPNTISCKRYDQ